MLLRDQVRRSLQPGAVLVTAAIALPLLLFALAAWQSHRVTLVNAQHRAEQMARILQEHALKVLDTQHLVVEQIRDYLRANDGSRGDNLLGLHQLLARLQAETEQVTTIAVTDAAGGMRASARVFPADPKMGFADREWFQTIKDGDSRTIYVSKPIIGRQTGRRVAEVAAEAFGGERDGHDRVEYGKTYRFCSIARPSFRHEDLRGALLRTGAGWSHPEDWGIWTTARSVRMEFRLPGVEGDVLVYLGLAMPSEPVEVSFHLNGWSSRIAPGRACLYMMRIPAAHLGDGRVVLDIVNGSLVDVSQHNPADKRVLGVGLRNLTVCRAGDFEARLAMIEGGESIVAIEARDRLEEVW